MRIPNWRTWPNQVFTVPVGITLGGWLAWQSYDDLTTVPFWLRVAAGVGLTCWAIAPCLIISEVLRRLRRRAVRPLSRGGAKPPHGYTWQRQIVEVDPASPTDMEWWKTAHEEPDLPLLVRRAEPDRSAQERARQIRALLAASGVRGIARHRPERWPWFRVHSGLVLALLMAGVLALGVLGSLGVHGLFMAGVVPKWGLLPCLMLLAFALGTPAGILGRRWFRDREI